MNAQDLDKKFIASIIFASLIIQHYFILCSDRFEGRKVAESPSFINIHN